MIQSRWNQDQEYLSCPCFAQPALNGLPSCLPAQPVPWCWGSERWESAGQLLLKEGIPQAADRRLPVYVQAQKWRFVFIVSAHRINPRSRCVSPAEGVILGFPLPGIPLPSFPQGQGRGLWGWGSPRRGLPAGAAGSSHAPRLQGWVWSRLSTTRLSCEL